MAESKFMKKDSPVDYNDILSNLHGQLQKVAWRGLKRKAKKITGSDAQTHINDKLYIQAENEATDVFVYIIDGLRENDFAKIKKYTGKNGCKLESYILDLAASLRCDYIRSKKGRRRMPKRASDLGIWAEEAFELLCWNKFSLDETFELLVTKGVYKNDYTTFQKDTILLKAIPCSQNPYYLSNKDPSNPTVSFADDAKSYFPAADTDTPLDILIKKISLPNRTRAIGIIKDFLVSDALSETQKLLIKMIYIDGLSVAATGRGLGLSDAKARSLKKKTLAMLQEELLKNGIRKQ